MRYAPEHNEATVARRSAWGARAGAPGRWLGGAGSRLPEPWAPWCAGGRMPRSRPWCQRWRGIPARHDTRSRPT